MKAAYKSKNRGSIVVAVALALALFAGSGTASANVGTWTNEQIGGSPGGHNLFPSVAYDSNGLFYAVWKQGSSGPIRLAKWEGTGWTTVSDLTTSMAGVNYISDSLSLKIDGSNNIHLAFKAAIGSGTSSERGVWYGCYDGSDWTIQKVKTYSDSHGWKNTYYPSLALDSSGNPHIAYVYKNDNEPRKYSIRYATRSGSTWSVALVKEVSGSGAGDATMPSLAIDSAGHGHISYMQNAGGENKDDDLWYATNASGSWAFTQLVTGDSVTPGRSSLALDSSGKVHIAYAEYTNRQVRYMTNASGSWSSPALIASNASGQVTLSINSSGNKMIAYNHSSGDVTSLGVATKQGGNAWETELAFSGEAETDDTWDYPACYIGGAINNGNRVLIVHHRDKGDWDDEASYVMSATGILGGTDPCAGVTCTSPPTQCHGNGTCNPATGQCQYSPLAAGTSCDDGIACTVNDECLGDASGTCEGEDIENPDITTCGADVIVTADAGQCGAMVVAGVPTVADNCGIDTITNDYNNGDDASGFYAVGTTTVVWTARDVYGNESTCEQKITVTDDEDPAFDAFDWDVTVECGLDTDPAATGTPTADDNCSVDSIVPSDVNTTGCGLTQVITRTWRVEDVNGNAVEEDQTIDVVDTTPPTLLNCPVDFSVPEKNASGKAVVDWVPPTAFDVCSSTNGLPVVGNMKPGKEHEVGFHRIRYETTDDCGHVTTCGFVVELFLDCNSNGAPDYDDIALGTSPDCNSNAIPDECDLWTTASLDCNTNSIPDECDIADGTSLDVNSNAVPDECDECVYDSQCDDGLYCNGTETCAVDVCVDGRLPCAGLCSEVTDRCFGGGGGNTDDNSLTPDTGPVEEEVDDEGKLELEDDGVVVTGEGLPAGATAAFDTVDDGDSFFTVESPTGETLINLEVVGVGPDVQMHLVMNDGNPQIVLTMADGSVAMLDLQGLPAGSSIVFRRDSDGSMSVEVYDSAGESVDVVIRASEAGNSVTFRVRYLESGSSRTARLVSGFAGFDGEQSVGGAVEIGVEGLEESGSISVSLTYDEDDLTEIDETTLRLFKLDAANAEYKAPGTNDVGVSALTDLLGDYGVDTSQNSAWAVVDSGGVFAVGVPAGAVAPEATPEPSEGPEAEQPVPSEEGADEAAGCGAGAAPCGAAGMVSWLLMLGGLAAMKRGRSF